MRGIDEYYYESLSEFTQEKQQQLNIVQRVKHEPSASPSFKNILI